MAAVFLLPSLLGVLLLVLLPFADVIRRSFLTAVTGEWIGISNYVTVFHTPAFLLAVNNTLRFTLIGLPLLIGLGLLTAAALNRLQTGKRVRILKSFYLFPMAIPTAAVVLVWNLSFSRQGFLNLLLTRLSGWLGLGAGPVSCDWLNSGAAFYVLVFSYIWKNLGYTVVLWLAGIQSVPDEVLEAARVDGAGERQSFRLVVLPNLKGTLTTIVVLSFLNSFKIYREAYLTAGAYPDKSMYLLQHLFNNWFTNLELDKMAAAAVCIAVALFGAILLLQRLWDREGT